MTIDRVKNTPEIVDYLLDKSVIADSRKKLHKRLEELCNLAIKALEQEPCDDCISRSALMIALMDKGVDHIQSDDLAEINQIVSELPSVNPQKWIPVSEELPEEETDVLICNENGDIELSRGSYSTEVENDFIWYTSGWRFGEVIAWMPLPEPFRAESEGER